MGKIHVLVHFFFFFKCAWWKKGGFFIWGGCLRKKKILCDKTSSVSSTTPLDLFHWSDIKQMWILSQGFPFWLQFALMKLPYFPGLAVYPGREFLGFCFCFCQTCRIYFPWESVKARHKWSAKYEVISANIRRDLYQSLEELSLSCSDGQHEKQMRG